MAGDDACLHDERLQDIFGKAEKVLRSACLRARADNEASGFMQESVEHKCAYFIF